MAKTKNRVCLDRLEFAVLQESIPERWQDILERWPTVEEVAKELSAANKREKGREYSSSSVHDAVKVLKEIKKIKGDWPSKTKPTPAELEELEDRVVKLETKVDELDHYVDRFEDKMEAVSTMASVLLLLCDSFGESIDTGDLIDLQQLSKGS